MLHRTFLAAGAFTLFHFFLIVLTNDRFSIVWMELPVLALFGWLASKGRLSVNLTLCVATVCAFLLAEPAVGAGPIIWIALIPLFELVRRESKMRVLAAWGLWTGLLVDTGIYAWMWRAVVTFFETSLASAFPLFIIIAVGIAAQFALFLPLARLLYQRSRIAFAVAAPLLYVAIEYWMPLPLPVALGLAFAQQPLLLQAADVAGLHGISLLIALVNGALWLAWRSFRASDVRRAAVLAACGVAVIVIQVGYGAWCLKKYAPVLGGNTIDIAMIQPVSPLRVMNTETQLQEDAAATLRELSLQACESGSAPPDLLLWPEGAGSFASRTPEFNPAYMEAVRAVQSQTSVPLVTQDIEFTRETGTNKIRYYSTVSLIEPVGKTAASYRKNILMPFGEFLPLERQLPILRKWLPQARSILVGETALPLAGPRTPFAPLICFEVLYPKHATRVLGDDAGYLINLTNDRWYGRRQQPIQHLAFAVLRSIENRRPMARATNSGISALIDARGVIGDAKTATMQKTWLRGKLAPRTGYTFYNRYGAAAFPILISVAALAILLRALLRRRSSALSAN